MRTVLSSPDLTVCGGVCSLASLARTAPLDSEQALRTSTALMSAMTPALTPSCPGRRVGERSVAGHANLPAPSWAAVGQDPPGRGFLSRVPRLAPRSNTGSLGDAIAQRLADHEVGLNSLALGTLLPLPVMPAGDGCGATFPRSPRAPGRAGHAVPVGGLNVPRRSR